MRHALTRALRRCDRCRWNHCQLAHSQGITAWITGSGAMMCCHLPKMRHDRNLVSADASQTCVPREPSTLTPQNECDNPDPVPRQRTYLEKRFSMRPLGVVSKKTIGDRKMANAILSCNLREACRIPAGKSSAVDRMQRCAQLGELIAGGWKSSGAYLDRTEDPQDQRLNHDQACRSHAESEVDAKVEGYIWVGPSAFVDLHRRQFGPQTLRGAHSHPTNLSTRPIRLCKPLVSVTFGSMWAGVVPAPRGRRAVPVSVARASPTTCEDNPVLTATERQSTYQFELFGLLATSRGR